MKLPRWSNTSREKYLAAAWSSVGLVRSENQDSHGIFGSGSEDRLFIVADGMGGHTRGREASLLAVESVREIFYSEPSEDVRSRLLRAFDETNERIYKLSQKYGKGTQMGTTCTTLAVSSDRFYIGHVGDSRAYKISQEGAFQLTTDHTLVNLLVNSGELSVTEALSDPRRHNLMQAIGIGISFDPDVFEITKPDSGEKIILCSDGLAVLSAEEIAVVSRSRDVQDICETLVEMANERGGPDNTTVLAFEVIH
ncbi:MAG: Stp1/IreP family PP2C-type Ser/Thr phosphatase [Rhodothermia bacterium]|nr:MAG: Stp1/IreP family PP2C-type Ser/Thr phosphatase [Rhodothermia bacterium]